MRPGLPASRASAVEMAQPAITDLGVRGYREVHALQLSCVERQLADDRAGETILLTEHPPVFTLGSSAGLGSLIRSREEIAAAGIEVIRCERGGDVTYHGPGQLVAYPIVNLRRRGLKVTAFVDLLETVMLRTAADFGVAAGRDPRNRGIWVAGRKLGSIGIRVRRGISFHGLALNVNLDLDHFSWIQPCGLHGVAMTSLQRESGDDISMTEVKAAMRRHLDEQLHQK